MDGRLRMLLVGLKCLHLMDHMICYLMAMFLLTSVTLLSDVGNHMSFLCAHPHFCRQPPHTSISRLQLLLS